MNALIRPLTVLFFIIFCLQLPAFADWPCRTDISIPVAASSGNQTNLRLCPDGKNGAIVVWQDRRGGLTDKLYLQRIGASGNPLWQEGGVSISRTAGFQYYPQILPDGQGGAYIVWEDNRSGVDYDIYAQRISSTGVSQWSPGGVVVCNAPGHQYNPQIIADGVGGVIITWQDQRSGQFDIFAQRLNGAGRPMWQLSNGAPACIATGDQTEPRIVSDGAGGAIIAWTDYRGGTSDIYGQRISNSGQSLWTSDGIVICGASNIQWNTQIVSDGIGGGIICWQDRRTGTYDNIYAQRIDGNGQQKWAQDGVQIAPSSGPQYYPRMVSDGLGGAVVAWQDNRLGIDYDIYAQRISSGGQSVWTTDGRPVCTASGHQYNPQLIKNAAGVLLTWQDKRNGSNFDIYAQRLDLNGLQQWSLNGIPVTSFSYDQFAPQVASDDLDGGVVAWLDYRNLTGYTNIYSQRIGSNGRPGGGCYETFIQDSLGLKSTRWTKRFGWFPMPNAGNVRDAVLAQGYFPDGITIGVMRLDSAKRYGWLFYYNRGYLVRRAFPQNGIPRAFAYLNDRYFTGRLRNPFPRIYNNALAGELLALKLNIASSDAGITESQFGDLIFRDTSGIINPLDRKSLRQITSAVDSMLTFWRKYLGVNYMQLYHTLRDINAAFAGPIDTISTTPLKIKPTKTLFSIPTLVPNVAPAAVVLPPFQPNVIESQIPEDFALNQNYPNPFNPYTIISFNLPEPAYVTLKVYNMLGQEVAVLINRESIDDGPQVVEFNALNLSSGVYFYQLVAEPLNHQHKLLSSVKKMMLLK